MVSLTPQAPNAMPYVICSHCDTTAYTAARFTTVDDCPRCGQPLRRRFQEYDEGRVKALTNSSSWPVVQHSNASQYSS